MANVSELSGRVGKRLGVPKRAAKVVIEALLEEVAETLGREEPVYLHGFGRFYFNYQRNFNRDYYERRGVLPQGEDLSVRVCQFRFVKRLRESLNGIDHDVGLESSDLMRLDYKTREIVTRIPELRAEIRAALAGSNGDGETARRAAAGIDLGAVLERLNEEMRA